MAEKLKTCLLIPEMKWPQNCLKQASDEFKVKVDWDVDHTGAEGCHGTDTFSDDKPIELTFTTFKNGAAMVTGFDTTYLMTSSGRLLWLGRDRFCKRNAKKNCTNSTMIMQGPGFPLKRVIRNMQDPDGKVIIPMHFIAYSANRSFYKCYQESKDLNPKLSDMQKLTVDRFFAAVKHVFPSRFTGSE